jgi:hypothetical protein
MISVLFIGAVDHPLSANLAEKLNRNGNLKIDAIYPLTRKTANLRFEQKYNKVYRYNLFYNKLNIPNINTAVNIFRLIVCLLRIGKYDIIHLQFVRPELYFLVPLIRVRSKRLAVTVWGSDFEERNKHFGLVIKVLKTADKITCSNSIFRDRIISLLKCEDRKVSIISDNLNVLDEIKALRSSNKEDIKRSMNIPPDHLVISCGTNARMMQRHAEIIDEIAKAYSKLNKPVLLLFQMTYGDHPQDYLRQIEDKLAESGLPYRILVEFFAEKEAATIRIISDILIQVQDHDQLSAAMLETLYAGNLLITGSWLPYSILDDNGIFYFKANKLDDLSDIVLNCVNSYVILERRTSDNPGIVEEITGHAAIVKTYEDFYSQLCL